MQLHKAVRHLILAQASLATRSLRAAGNAVAAAEIERTANLLEFAGDADRSVEGGEERASGRAAIVTMPVSGRAPLTRIIEASGFQLYSRDGAGLAADGADHRAMANAARAAEIFAEFHAARMGAPLESSVVAALRGDAVGVDVATPSEPFSSWVILALLMAAAAALADDGARLFGPILVATAWWGSREVSRSAPINLMAAALPLLWRHEPAAAALPALLSGAAISVWLRGEATGASPLWTVVGGVLAGALVFIQPLIGGALLAGTVIVWGAGWLLFVRFRPVVVALAAGGALAGYGAAWWGRGFAPLWWSQMTALSASPPDAWALAGVSALVAVLVVLVLVGWFVGTHRRPLAMLLPVVLLAVTVGTLASGFGWDLHGLSAVVALALTLIYRVSRPLVLGRAARRDHGSARMQAGG